MEILFNLNLNNGGIQEWTEKSSGIPRVGEEIFLSDKEFDFHGIVSSVSWFWRNGKQDNVLVVVDEE